jgi:hypothetical protein
MPQIPTLESLLKDYPGKGNDGAAVAVLVGGSVQTHFEDANFPAYKDTCAIRVSRALNTGGDPIPKGGNGLPNPYMTPKKIRTDKGGDEKFYIYSVYDLRAYLDGRYGNAKKYKKTITQADLAKENVKGIIVFAYWHADIWDGTTCRYHNNGFGQSKVQEILVYPASGG